MSPPDPKYPGRPTGPISPAELACASWANESMTSYVRAFDEFREGIEDCLDLTDDQHFDALLRWLNRWGARIPGAHFSEARKRLPDWYGSDQGSLPDDGVSLVEASDADLAPCADLYDDLISIMDGHAERKSWVKIGPTAVSKILFALRPHLFPAWDSAMRETHLRGGQAYDGSGASYARFVREVQGELQETAKLCPQLQIQLDDLPVRLGRSPYTTPAQLMIEYYFVVITKKARPCHLTLRPKLRTASK